jgi:glycosyltransferase involved in cell wall biosynthesis
MSTLQRLERAGSVLKDAAISRLAAPYSRLYLVSDGPRWVLGEEALQLVAIARRLGLRASLAGSGSGRGVARQSLFFMAHLSLETLIEGAAPDTRLAFPYFHGVPRPEEPEFGRVFDALCRRHPRIARLQVSCRAMQRVVLGSGIAPEKVHLIPIGIEPALFPPVNAERRAAARRRHGIPDGAFVVGSFQKDGVGFGDGDAPKLIKGPDVLVEVCRRLRGWGDLHVLLSGPARGYVRRELAASGIALTHVRLDDYRDMATLYHATDVTLVTSREEGGPKAVLESMASAVPLVTTRVGQAADLVESGVNAVMVDVGDVAGLVAGVETVRSIDAGRRAALVAAAAATAAGESYEAQLPRWRAFMKGFVEQA